MTTEFACNMFNSTFFSKSDSVITGFAYDMFNSRLANNPGMPLNESAFLTLYRATSTFFASDCVQIIHRIGKKCVFVCLCVMNKFSSLVGTVSGQIQQLSGSSFWTNSAV